MRKRREPREIWDREGQRDIEGLVGEQREKGNWEEPERHGGCTWHKDFPALSVLITVASPPLLLSLTPCRPDCHRQFTKILTLSH